MIVARKLFLPSFIIALWFQNNSFVLSGEWRCPLNRWTFTWLQLRCVPSERGRQKMIWCGRVSWIIYQLGSSGVMCSLNHRTRIIGGQYKPPRSLPWHIVHFYWSMRLNRPALFSHPRRLVILMAKPNHVTSICGRKTAIPLSPIICRRPSYVEFNQHQSRKVNSVDKERRISRSPSVMRKRKKFCLRS